MYDFFYGFKLWLCFFMVWVRLEKSLMFLFMVLDMIYLWLWICFFNGSGCFF